jgi:hypothetical protein
MALVQELIRSVPFVAGSISLLAVYAFAFIWEHRHPRQKHGDDANVAALIATIGPSSPHGK